MEPKPDDWQPTTRDEEWPGRKGGPYQWYEIQDSVAYWEAFQHPRIFYNDITWYSSFCIDTTERFTNNSGYFIPSGDPLLVAVLNSPIGWWFAWRKAQHGKDEALRYFSPFVEAFPIPTFNKSTGALATETVDLLSAATANIRTADRTLADWLTVEIGLAKLPTLLSAPSKLDSDNFVAAVRAAMPRRASLSPQKLKDLRDAFADIAEPARTARTTALANERTLSDIVNRAYGLTPEDIALMWRTAPPRMPVPPPG